MKKTVLLVVLALLIGTAPAMAAPFYFSDIPDGGALDISGNFSGEVKDIGGTQVQFTISNNGTVASTIDKVFFEYSDNLLSGGSFVQNMSSTGVNFVPLDNPNLPQGENIFFDADFGMDAVNPAPNQNGVDIGEHAAFLFYGNFGDVILAMNQGNMRIGMHVINIGEDSDSYVSNPPSPVPEPATLLLLGVGLIGLSGIRKKIIT